MDNNDSIDKTSELHASEAAMTVFCKLFSDKISRHLCDLRRRELSDREIFSCKGCIALNSMTGSKNSA